MLELAERKTEAKLAKKSGEYTIAGPYELKQGGKVLYYLILSMLMMVKKRSFGDFLFLY